MSNYDDDRDRRDESIPPEVDDRGRKWPGLAAVALFGVLAYVFVGAEFGEAAGFPNGAEITASIGYAMFNIGAQNAVASEGFLVAFEIIDVVLVAALVGAVMLARRDEGGTITSALRSDAVEDEGQVAVADGGEPTDTQEGEH
ncbi:MULTISPECIES: NADH-quinone oxidoreductase subunit J [Halorussus]|uniref:NADH-quinone oxidoreductase subunit J family protein n=1 Tax=Halorussus TaxID=1070314 RepID=UPI00209E3EEF|nr:proton-conducting membrane transporter [Halorussus vallis]USZ75589.1 proton-conducting membrane transporter [Halorussus vallis]